MNLFELIRSVNDFQKSIHLLDERHSQQTATNDENRKATATLREELAALTVRVAVLEAKNDAIDDRVRRVMTEVVADWKRQHNRRETERLQAELDAVKRERLA